MEHQVQRADRAGLHAGEAAVELEPLVGEHPAGSASLGDALFAEINVPPAGKAILKVPLRLAVAQQDEGRHQASTFSAAAPFSALAFLSSGRMAWRLSR